jgi:hypothetical protein
MALFLTSASCHVILLICGLLHVAAAQESPDTTSAYSKTVFVGWVSEGDTRATWDILTSCLLTIMACTWSVLHLNLPDQEDGSWCKIRRKLKWTVVTVFFPEFILAHAASERQVVTIKSIIVRTSWLVMVVFVLFE